MTDNMLDRSSPRRGSLTLIHRQPSGSFSHSSRLASSSSTTATATAQVNSAHLHTICKDLDKFTRYFIIKSVQVIVQSRIEGNKKVKTECKPNGNDWFNINIPDIAEISDKTKAILDSDNLSVKSNWRVCCEISLRSNDGTRIVLEHWIISNRSNFISNQKPTNSQASPRGNRASTNHLVSSNTTVATGNVVNSASASSRVRPSQGPFGGFVSVSRTRLNSIDDDTCDINPASGNSKLLLGVNNENVVDLKSSTSCFSLSSTPSSQQHADQTSLFAPSPSTNSLNSNHATNTLANQDRSASNSPSLPQQSNNSNSSKTSATSSIYTIYNKMSLLLKTLMTTAYIVPAHRLASKNPQTSSYTMCYRVYTCPMPPQQFAAARGSIENINNPAAIGRELSPNRRSLSSNSSLASVNIREFVGPEELDSFCPIFKLGSVKTEIGELDVSFCYRTDVRNPSHLLKSWRSKENYNQIIDEDCIIAAKQLLAGNYCLNGNSTQANYKTSNGTINSNNIERTSLDYIDKPLKPAFASNDKDSDKNVDSSHEVLESAFVGLLQNRYSSNDDNLVDIASDAINHAQMETNNNSPVTGRPNVAKSEPIQVPRALNNQPKHQDLYQNLSAGSTPKSLTDSFVFVDLNPPFASEEQNDINSFFHGPSPSFNNNSFDGLKDVDDLMNQLNVIEANASQIDDFVDNICASEDEEEDEH